MDVGCSKVGPHYDANTAAYTKQAIRLAYRSLLNIWSGYVWYDLHQLDWRKNAEAYRFNH